VIDRHRELRSPVSQHALDLRLPEREIVTVSRQQVAGDECRARERCRAIRLSSRDEAFNDAPLIEQFEHAHVQPACA
jgi:hypothetical protein